MENKVSYTIVGIFVLSFFIGIILFILWLARYDIDKSNLKYYKIYVKDSISGLQKNSIVSYKGLDIGQVESIKIDKTNIEQIEVLLFVSDYTIIKKNSYAVIESKGITGNKYIEIMGGTHDSDVLEVNSNGFGIIPLQKSFMNKITSDAGDIVNKFDGILEKLNLLISEKTILNVEQIAENINISTKHLYKEQMNFDLLINKIDSILSKDNISNISIGLNNMKEATQEINSLMKEDIKSLINQIKTTLKNANNNSNNINATLDKFENLMLNVDEKIDTISNDMGKVFQVRDIKYGPGEIK